MKNLIIALLFLTTGTLTYAQQQSNGSTLVGANQNMKLYGVFIGDEDNRSYKGSPYVNEELKQGYIDTATNDKQVFYLRYNVLHERIEFSKTNDKSTLKALPKIEDFVIFIDGKSYQYIESGNLKPAYYEIIKQFDNNTYLLNHLKMSISKPVQQSSYAKNTKSRIVKSNTLYLFKDNSAIELQNHKKKVLKSFPESSKKELKNYISDNKLKFKNDYKGLIAVITKYNNL